MRIALFVLAATLPLAAAAQELKPGNYRTTMTGDMPGMDGKPIEGDTCITQKDVDSGLTKLGVEKDTDCKVLDFKRSPGRVSYKMSCPEDKTMSDVQGTFGADTLDFKMVMKTPDSPKPINLRIQGKRNGNCK